MISSLATKVYWREMIAESQRPEESCVSLFAVGSVLLRRRGRIVGATVFGFFFAAALVLMKAPVYESSALFQPQTQEGTPSGLAQVARSFGITTPADGGAWGPATYVELLRSRTVLEPIARDSFVVSDKATHRSLSQLLKVDEADETRRIELTVAKLREITSIREKQEMGAVKFEIVTSSPRLSFALAKRLIAAVDRFNVEMRRSRAAAEREFVATQVTEARRDLREAEDRLLAFVQRNRNYREAPELTFQYERLQRDVVLRQQVYTSLVQNLEQARIREIRDTPVLTVLEEPAMPSRPNSRNLFVFALLGAGAGFLFGAILAIVLGGWQRARNDPSPTAKEFFALVDRATPRFRRGKT